MKLFPLACLIALAAACASHPKPAAISAADGPEAAIATQEGALAEARKSHVDVLAPTQFDSAKEFLSEAKDDLKDGEKKDVYENLGISKAYLDKANAKTVSRTPQLQEVVAARQAAMDAGLEQHRGALKNPDSKLKEFTADSDDFKAMNSSDKAKLQASYLAAELATIKTSRLDEVTKTLDLARSKGAAKLTPKAYNDAQMKYRAAEKAIEADRHTDSRIRPAVAAAAAAANHVLKLSETALSTQAQTPEQRALALEARDKALQDADSLNAAVTEETMVQGDALAAQGAALTAVAADRNALKRREMQDQAVKKAAAMFDSSEAEVYRQGDNLVVRLKQMNFASGRSDLPAQSLPVLAKVKGVIQDLGPGAVMIEGHTDAVGNANNNQALSEKRAAAVEKYFESDEALAENKFDTAGYGYSKPLTSNKTKEGRAQNRRVDIVITPSSSI